MEQVHDADLLEEGSDGIRRLSTSLEPLENLFLIESDHRLLVVRIVETDLFDETIVTSLTVVDDDCTIDGVVTLAKTGETDNCRH